MGRDVTLIVLVSFALMLPSAGAGQFIDSRASFSGPFNGATALIEMAQTMEVGIAGYVRGLEVYVINDAAFDWYLRDGTDFDPVAINVEELPILAMGTAWGDTSGAGYSSPPVVLLPAASIPVLHRQLLVLHLVTGNDAPWMSGPGSLPGDRYIRASAGSDWELHPATGREFGRVVYVDYSPAPVEACTWGAIKALYRSVSRRPN